MKFENFLKEFNSIYLLKVFQKSGESQEKEENQGNYFEMESRRFKVTQTNQWKCYVFGSFWKGKRFGGPKIDMEKVYVSNLKSRFKKEEKSMQNLETQSTQKPKKKLNRNNSHRQKDSGIL